MAIFVNQHVRRMRGGAQSHLMRAFDGNFYVVKFKNNPQHPRVLANEWIATHLAARIGLPVPVPVIVDVGEWLIRKTPELHIQLGGHIIPCQAGLQFGAQYVLNPMDGQVLDYMPESLLKLQAARVRNPEVFAGMLAFDKWACNADGRQGVFWKSGRERKYTVTFIDNGHCFNAGDWDFPDSPLRGVYAMNVVYAGVTGWASFEPWLSRIELMDDAYVYEVAGAVPPEWYDGDWDALQALMAKLLQRRLRVRELIEAFRTSTRNPFPNWRDVALSEAQRPQLVM